MNGYAAAAGSVSASPVPPAAFSMKVVVDLTPLADGGQSRGARQFVVHLVRDLIAIAPHIEFVLLTSPTANAELRELAAPNVVHHPVEQPGQTPQQDTPSALTSPLSLRRRVRLALTRVLAPSLMLRIERAYLAATGQRPKRIDLPATLGANVFFSPFTTSFFQEPGVPSVSLVHDVRVLQYPRFFPPGQRAALRRALERAADLSDRLVCSSAFVQQTILDNLDVAPSKLVTIQPRPFSTLPRVADQETDAVLDRLGLTRGTFLLYPSTFGRHKNHAMLLTAFSVFVTRHPDSSLRLVCPGERGAAFDEMVRTVAAMHLEHRVLFPGYVSDTDLVGLYQGCRAVMFPPLDEGFGLPVMQAMALGRPVLCASYAALRQVAGDAAVYFDPRLLSDVVEVIERAAFEPDLLEQVAASVKTHVLPVDDPTHTAREYARLFAEVAA